MVPWNEPEVKSVLKFGKRLTMKLPVAPSNRPVPPVMVTVSRMKTTRGTPSSVVSVIMSYPFRQRVSCGGRLPRSSLACPPTSPALFYLRDTLRAMSDASLPGGAVAMVAMASPLGAMKRPKEGPLGTVKLPVQSALTV
jgi:hypothetical protein